MKRVLCIISMSFLFVVSLSLPAHAHERRPVGTLTTVVGWINEPTFAGAVNAVSFRATRGEAGVTGAKLRVDVSYEGAPQPLTLPLEPAFNDDGHYKAALVPTRSGIYTFRIYGTLAGKAFDERYTAGEETFSPVEGTGEVEYPEKDPTRDELGLLAKTQGERIVAMQKAATKAQDAADLARILALAALAFGVAGFVVAMRATRRTRA